MRRARGAEQAAMRLQVEVELGGVRDVRVDDGASRAVARAAVAILLVLREEALVVALGHDDHRNLRVDA